MKTISESTSFKLQGILGLILSLTFAYITSFTNIGLSLWLGAMSALTLLFSLALIGIGYTSY